MPQILVLRFASYVIYYIKQTAFTKIVNLPRFASYVIYYIKQTNQKIELSDYPFASYVIYYIKQTKIMHKNILFSLLVMLFSILSKPR